MTQLSLINDEYLASLSQWYTPPWLAERVVAWALEGVDRPLRILEPSAGLGALIRPIPRRHRVTAIEVDPRRVEHLRDLEQVEEVHCEDYLQAWRPEGFDLVLMNPPYENEGDALHVRKAVCSNSRVVAILRLAALESAGRWNRLWSIADIRRLAILVARPRFDGPQGLTPSGGTVVVELELAPHPRALREARPLSVEWW